MFLIKPDIYKTQGVRAKHHELDSEHTIALSCM